MAVIGIFWGATGNSVSHRPEDDRERSVEINTALDMAEGKCVDAPVLRSVFDDVRAGREHEERARISPRMRLVLFLLVLVFMVARAMARIEASGPLPPEDATQALQEAGESGGELTDEELAELEHAQLYQQEDEALQERADQNEAFVLSQMQQRHHEPFEMDGAGIRPHIAGTGQALCTVAGVESGDAYDLLLAYDSEHVVTDISEETPRDDS